MKSIVFNSVLLVLVSLICCHGLFDGIVLKVGKIEDDSNVAFLTVGSKLTPTSYLLSFFEPSIRMFDNLNKLRNKTINHKSIVNESPVAPLIRYNTSTQIPDPNAAKRIIRQANNADGLFKKTNITKSHHIYNNTMNSTAEHSSNIIYNSMKQYSFYNWVPYVMMVKKHCMEKIDTMVNSVPDWNWKPYILTIKNHSTEIIDNMLNSVSKWAPYLMIKQHMDLLPIIGGSVLLGMFCGILLFVAVKARKLRNARRELNQRPEDILVCLV